MADKIKNKSDRHPIDTNKEKELPGRGQNDVDENQDKTVDSKQSDTDARKPVQHSRTESMPLLRDLENDNQAEKNDSDLNVDPKKIGNIPSENSGPIYSERRKNLMDDRDEIEIYHPDLETIEEDGMDREDIDRDMESNRYFLNGDVDKSFMNNSRFYPDRSSFRNRSPFNKR